jgi:hypothetical protein
MVFMAFMTSPMAVSLSEAKTSLIRLSRSTYPLYDGSSGKPVGNQSGNQSGK